MPWTRSSRNRLRRLFLQGFSVMDIAEVLASFDEDRPVEGVREFMRARNFDLIGVRKQGVVAGYARLDDLETGTCGDHLRPFGTNDLVPETASLPDSIHSLAINGRCFVMVLDRVGAIVTLSDLEKPPVRMYLFGMITIVEMMFVRLIERAYPDGAWVEWISSGRLDKAKSLATERKRRGLSSNLVDCLQFSDKGQIIFRNDEILKLLQFESKRAALAALKEIEALRNNLAHTQQIITSDWQRIANFSGGLENLLASVEGALGEGSEG